MSHQTNVSLHTLPVQLVYCILDNVSGKTLFMSCYGVCRRLNDIMDTYKPYKVIFHSICSSPLKYAIVFQKSIFLVLILEGQILEYSGDQFEL
jgi:hypothetical protein